MSAAKGSRRERQLVNALYDAGWAAVRIPTSGAATDRELPDVFAMRGHPSETWESMAIAVEVKANADEYAALNADEVHDLDAFVGRAGSSCLALVATHPDRDRWHFWPTTELNERRSGYSVTKSMYPGRPLDSLLGFHTGGDGDE